jgi:hypothetical protein
MTTGLKKGMVQHTQVRLRAGGFAPDIAEVISDLLDAITSQAAIIERYEAQVAAAREALSSTVLAPRLEHAYGDCDPATCPLCRAHERQNP